MADKDKKRYYWLKLKEDFFEEETIAWLEDQPNGKEYSLFYLKLCLRSLKNNGILVRNVGSVIIPYDAESLGKITNTSADTVKVALDVFRKIGLISLMDSGEIYMNQLKEMVGSETHAAIRKRTQRADGTLSQGCPKNVAQSIEFRDKSIENRDKDIKEDVTPPKKPKAKSTRHKYGEYQNVLLSDEEMTKLKNEFPNDWEQRIERVSEYVASTGKSYKNYLATIRNWAKKDKWHPAKQNTSKNEKLPEWIDKPVAEDEMSEADKKAFMERIQKLKESQV